MDATCKSSPRPDENDERRTAQATRKEPVEFHVPPSDNDCAAGDRVAKDLENVNASRWLARKHEQATALFLQPNVAH